MFKKYIVITGASSGLGYEFAKSFAEINKNLILIARRKELLENLKQEINELNPNINVIIKIADLSNTENVYNIYNELKIYNIETWINNAGMGDYGYDIYDKNNIYKINKIEKMLKLNIEALTIFSMLFIQDYKDVENTQLINISSAGGYNIVFARVPYSSTKFYVNAFTEGFRFASDWRMVMYALLIIIMMWVRPQGLFGAKDSVIAGNLSLPVPKFIRQFRAKKAGERTV